MRTLPGQTDARLLVGLDTFDDAGIVRLSETLALVQTVDFFPPMLNDPHLFGQVAAANSLSDIYAMGGTPLTAMSIVAFPSDQLPLEILGEILRGGSEKISEAGAMLVGGHSVRDPEIKFGLSVTGTVHPDKIASNSGARPGDILILTKLLGMGPLTSAYRKGSLSDDDMKQAGLQMARLNKPAAEAMTAVGINTPQGIHAATDVTGFGLVGHARNIARGSKMTLVFESNKLPFFPDSLNFSEQKCNTGALKQNEKLLEGQIDVSTGVPEKIRRTIFDAETSGGLLMAIAPESGAFLLKELNARGVHEAVEVGRVEAQGAFALRIV